MVKLAQAAYADRLPHAEDGQAVLAADSVQTKLPWGDEEKPAWPRKERRCAFLEGFSRHEASTSSVESVELLFRSSMRELSFAETGPATSATRAVGRTPEFNAPCFEPSPTSSRTLKLRLLPLPVRLAGGTHGVGEHREPLVGPRLDVTIIERERRR